MIGCLILGDSIAVGVGQARLDCLTVAKVGIGSAAYVTTLYPSAPRRAGLAVISLGVNDGTTATTLPMLRRLRQGLQAGRVIWLLPALKDDVRRIIRTAAQEHGDSVLDTRGQAGPDHLHPTGAGYRLIAAETAETGQRPLYQVQAKLDHSWSGHSHSWNDPFWTGHSLSVAARGLPIVRRPGVPLRWQPMMGAGSVYGAWPPPGAAFAAMPPRTFAFRAMPGH